MLARVGRFTEAALLALATATIAVSAQAQSAIPEPAAGEGLVPVQQEPKSERNSKAAMIVGLTFLGVTVIGTLAGVIAYGTAKSNAFDETEDEQERQDFIDRQQAIGIGFFIGSGVFAAVGTPLLIWGASKSAAEPAQTSDFDAKLLLGPSGASLRGSF